MVKKTIILLDLYFLKFYLTSLSGEENILPNLINSQEPEPAFFGPLEPEPLEKNTRSRSLRGSHLGKKSGAGAA